MLRAWYIAPALCFASAIAVCQTGTATQPPPPAQQLPSISDTELWAHFEKWTADLKPLPPGKSIGVQAFIDAWVAEGVSREEATRRVARINVLRLESLDRERVYWNAAFKLGGGPSAPLRLLQEAIRKVKPGRALDAGMGRGRNTIFLAENGWDAYGYDMAEDAIAAAQAAAKEAGVRITTYVAKQEDFDFGESKWDLILCSYSGIGMNGTHWPAVFWKALKPGGLVVIQGFQSTSLDWTKTSENWKNFHILRLEDEDPGYVDDDWPPSRTNRTLMLVARKEDIGSAK